MCDHSSVPFAGSIHCFSMIIHEMIQFLSMRPITFSVTHGTSRLTKYTLEKEEWVMFLVFDHSDEFLTRMTRGMKYEKVWLTRAREWKLPVRPRQPRGSRAWIANKRFLEWFSVYFYDKFLMNAMSERFNTGLATSDDHQICTRNHRQSYVKQIQQDRVVTGYRSALP